MVFSYCFIVLLVIEAVIAAADPGVYPNLVNAELITFLEIRIDGTASSNFFHN